MFDTPEAPTTDLYELLRDFKKSVHDSHVELTKTLRSDFNSAMASIRDQQTNIISDLASTKQKVETISVESSETRSELINLQQEVSILKKGFDDSTRTASCLSYTLPKSTNAPKPNKLAPKKVDEVLHNAKTILCFSPIAEEDILRLKDDFSLNDDIIARKIAIREFLVLEMSVPKSIADGLTIVRTFTPSKQPFGWSTLYAEFDCTSTVDLLNQMS